MIYFLTFLNGIITFLSPCILPMIPIYIAYLTSNDSKSSSILLNALGFVLGFTTVFVIIGGFFSFIGDVANNQFINYFSGGMVVFFGLNYLGVFNLNFLNIIKNRPEINLNNMNFFKSISFGMVFSLGWTPCLTTFLGFALATAASSDGKYTGLLLLFTYSLGLGIPFILSALLIKELTEVFNFIKKHYSIINKLSGLFLVIVGVLMILNII